MCVCVLVWTLVALLWRSENNLQELVLSTIWVPGSNPGGQAWLQAPLSTEPTYLFSLSFKILLYCQLFSISHGFKNYVYECFAYMYVHHMQQ